jgi:predicted acylesterase/phospholipase RssA
MFRKSKTTILASTCVGTLLALGCVSTSRLPASDERFNFASPVGFPDPVRLVDPSPASFRLHSVEVVNQLRKAAGGGEINVLALSGGGAGGAFAAGALVGLTQSGARPTFHLVTGVSTGALIAPLAFLGQDWDAQLRIAFTGESAQQLLKRRALAFVFGSALYDGQRLVSLVDRFVTDELMDAVAREARKGRMLLVETTDLDKEEPVIWDMGAIAIRGGPEAKKLFRDVLVASASIPVLFPPVVIRVEDHGALFDELHVDGSTTSVLFIAPEMAAVVPDAFEGASRINVYVLVNGQLGESPKSTHISSVSILSRSVSANLRHNARAAVALAFNVATNHNMTFKLTAIPDSYPYSGPLDFRAAAMRSLFDFAESCASRGLLWKTPEDAYEVANSTSSHSNGNSSPSCPRQSAATN